MLAFAVATSWLLDDPESSWADDEDVDIVVRLFLPPTPDFFCYSSEGDFLLLLF